MFQTFSTIASSIFLEGLFFLLIGVFISSIIDVFVSADTLERIIPKNKILALLYASLMGILFPICECGIVPVIRRLMKKGVPLYLCITLLLSSPIVNIVVIFSTYYAFKNYFIVVLLRVIGGFVISFTVGLIVLLFFKKSDVALEDDEDVHGCSCCSHSHVKETKLMTIGRHSMTEFLDTSKYFILGILITALIQSVVPRSIFNEIGVRFPISNLFMMFLSYILSVCSNTDAFIARSFMGQFGVSALLSFMIFGAMFDIKTTLLLKKIFKTSFIIKLIMIVMILTLIFSIIINSFVLGSV